MFTDLLEGLLTKTAVYHTVKAVSKCTFTVWHTVYLMAKSWNNRWLVVSKATVRLQHALLFVVTSGKVG
jgi:hypothetical protein